MAKGFKTYPAAARVVSVRRQRRLEYRRADPFAGLLGAEPAQAPRHHQRLDEHRGNGGRSDRAGISVTHDYGRLDDGAEAEPNRECERLDVKGKARGAHVGRDLRDDRRRVDPQPDLRVAHGEADEQARELAAALAMDAARRRSSRFRET